MSRTVIKTVLGFLLLLQLGLYGQGLRQLSFVNANGSVQAVQSSRSHLYFAENQESGSIFKSMSLADPSRPTLLDSFSAAGLIADFAINGNFAYLAMADNEQGIRILDISDPTDIQEVIYLEKGETFGTFLQDNLLYVADGGGLSVFSFTPDTLVFVWAYNTNMYGDGVEVFVDERMVYLNVFHTGLFALNKATRELEGAFSSADIGIGLSVNEHHAYISDRSQGLVVVDMSDPKYPVQVSTLSGSELGGGIIVSGDYAYFADGPNGLRVIDVSDPNRIAEKSVFVREGLSAVRAALNNSLVFLASGDPLGFGNIEAGVHILRNGFVTSINERTPWTPTTLVLGQNYPNPFMVTSISPTTGSPGTRIEYQIPRESQVRLEIFSVYGERVATIVDQQQPPGSHTARWNGRDDFGKEVSSGVYFYRLETKDLTRTSKLILLR